jgi:hypothetical protein
VTGGVGRSAWLDVESSIDWHARKYMGANVTGFCARTIRAASRNSWASFEMPIDVNRSIVAV